MANFFCGDGYVINWDAVSAMATLAASVVALVVGVWVPRYEHGLRVKDAKAADRKQIQGFLRQLADELNLIYMNCEFPAPIPEGTVRMPFTDIMRTAQTLEFLARMREKFTLFDDKTADCLLVAIDEIVRCHDLSIQLEAAAAADVSGARLGQLNRVFEQAQGGLMIRLKDLYRRLIDYGADERTWCNREAVST